MAGFSLKDQLFNLDKVTYLAGLLKNGVPKFPKEDFVKSTVTKLHSLELKQRIVWIATVLEEHLHQDYPAAVQQILNSLPPPLDENKSDDDFGDFIFAPFGEYVVRNGLKAEYVNLSLATLKELTKRFSMEDSIRFFIRQFPKQTMKELTRWCSDRNYHVRRLVSESTRPLLPWSGRIDLSTEETLPLLDRLHADKTRYVTRSVANHLNDIAKSNPELVVESLQKWRDLQQQDSDELQWMTRHSLRTLIKQGNADALSLLGFHPAPQITCGKLKLHSTRLNPGETLEFSIEIVAKRDESLVIDYVIEFAKAGGKRSTKVYKATKLNLQKGESQTVQKKHKLHAQATTYKLYPGQHQLTIQINGQAVASQSFELL